MVKVGTPEAGDAPGANKVDCDGVDIMACEA